MKLGLGTVQFGLDYGISNLAGRTQSEEVRNILQVAERSGVEVLDTAPAYGCSEDILGEVLGAKQYSPKQHPFRIVTKTPVIQTGLPLDRWPEYVEKSARNSLLKLNQTSLYGILAHRGDELLGTGGKTLYTTLVRLKEEGLVGRIGVSVYRSEEAAELLQRFEFDLMQIPISVFNQEFLTSGMLGRLRRAGVEVHARSVFLQGLLLMSPDRLPRGVGALQGYLERYFAVIRKVGLTRLQAALGFVIGLQEIDTVLCGVNDVTQLNEILRAADFGTQGVDLQSFAIADPDLINPAKWIMK